MVRLDKKGRIVVEKMTGSIIEETFGSWRGEKPGEKYVEEIRRDWKRRAEARHA